MGDLLPDSKREFRFTIGELIAGMQRELAYRDRVYGRLVADKKKTQAEADKGMALVRAVIEQLQTQPLDKVVKVPA